MRRTAAQLTAAELYWKEATDFVKRKSDDPKEPNWFVVTRESEPQLEAWSRYFIWRLGFESYGMTMLRNHKIETFLTPCEWPEWFDSKFSGVANDV